MTKEEYHNNVMQRNASIMIGALLQDAVASIDVLLTNPNSDKENLPAFMELARALYDSAEIIQERVADTDDIDRAMDDIDVVINKILKYREDLQ
jgi:hypothetical protein